MNNIIKLIKEEYDNIIIKNELIKRIPFLKEYNIVEHPRDKNRLVAQRIILNKDIKFMMGDEILNFPQFNISSDIIYYPHKVSDNIFHNFIIKNEIHPVKPKEMDDLTFRVFLMTIKSIEKNLSYNKEIRINDTSELSKNELDSVINDMNKNLFELEEFTNKYNINFF